MKLRDVRDRLPRVMWSLVSVVIILLTVWTPVSVWAEPEPPSDPTDIRSFVTETSWYDPSSNGTCALSGVTMSGQSDFLKGNPITLNYPDIQDQEKFALAMEGFMRNRFPNSPWLKIDDVGRRLAQEGQRRDVNPMLIIVIGGHETQLGTAPNSSAAYNNSFGNKGINPPGSPSTDYKIYPSFEASLFGDDSFTASVQQRISGQHPSYKDVTNMYEYLSVHVSGQIIYPNSGTVSYDSTMGVVIDADGENGYAGPLQYFQHAITWIGEMTGITISGIPMPGAGSCVSGCVGDLHGVTFSFPLEPCTKRDYTTLPCSKPTGCHHDGTAAFDLYWEPYEEMGGKKVYAVTDGRIVNAENYYNGVAGCYSIQFYSTTQQRYYWYGHLQKARDYVQPGQEDIKAGQQIAEVGDMALKAQGCSPGPPHLHIDRGCVIGGVGQTAGYPSCRDITFVADLNEVWERLPEDASAQ